MIKFTSLKKCLFCFRYWLIRQINDGNSKMENWARILVEEVIFLVSFCYFRFDQNLLDNQKYFFMKSISIYPTRKRSKNFLF